LQVNISYLAHSRYNAAFPEERHEELENLNVILSLCYRFISASVTTG